MTREFFTPERKRWIALFIHCASDSMLRSPSLNCYKVTVLSCRIRSSQNESLTPQFDDLLSLGGPPGAQSHSIDRAIATSAHCPSRSPTIPVTSSAAFWAALFSKRSTFSYALAPAISLRLRRIRHGTRRCQQICATAAPSISVASALNSLRSASFFAGEATNASP